MYVYGADLSNLPALELPRRLERLVEWLNEALAAANSGRPYLKTHAGGYGLQLVYHDGIPAHVRLGRRDVNGHAVLADLMEHLNIQRELGLMPPMLWTCEIPILASK